MKFKTITDSYIINCITKKQTSLLYIKYNDKRAFYSTDLIKWHMSSLERIKNIINI